MKLRIYLCAIAFFSFLFFSCGKGIEKIPAVPKVIGIQSIKSDIPWDIEYPAQVAGSLEVEVRAQVSGILKAKMFQEGEFVEAGKQLFLIDPEPFQVAFDKAKAGLAKANAALTKAQADYSRMKKLLAQEAVSRKEYDDANAAYESAKAEVEAAKANLKDAEINLKYTKVVAPISGITGASMQDIGSLISAAGDKGLLTTIIQINPLQAAFSIPGSHADSAKKGFFTGKLTTEKPIGQQAVKVKAILDDNVVYPFDGKLIFLDNKQDANTGSIAVKAEFPNPEGKRTMMPGRFIRVKLEGVTYKNAVIVPQTAILETALGPAVYIVGDDNIVKSVPVTYTNVGNLAIITSGIEGGETVVSEGVIKVVPGKPVELEMKEFDLPEQYKTKDNR
ncbi:MAG: efflux RND transporter periplasmic adaptor subunit [Endomicrobia bacterium]|nr:efflux RND transporter periplasmic adaptor subunit [Endomicrobiia bacterium]MCL2506279.1 efflux RND transporter periplasmic adaptor subunit [Endomicrobiia bacterium]